MDVVFLSLALALAGLTLGLIGVCHTLSGGQS
jgi:hypothetical protein